MKLLREIRPDILKREQNKIIIIIFTIAQVIYCFFPRPMIAMGDEVIYKQIAFEIHKFIPVSTFHYPFLYPLMIVPAVMLGENSYYGFIILNIVYKVIFLCIINIQLKKVIDKRYVSYILAMLAFSPIVFIWSKYIMSENLMAMLLIVTVLYYLIYQKNTFDESGLERSGVWQTMIAAGLTVCLFWTKYLALVLIPVFFLYWNGYVDFLKRGIRVDHYKKIKETSIIFFLTVIGLLIGYAWIYSIQTGTPFTMELLKESMGFSIGSGPENSGYFMIPKIKWIAVYTMYAALTCIVILASLCRYCHSIKRHWDKIIFMILLSAALIFVSARHSTYAGSVDGVMIKLVARYVEYISLFAVILFGILVSQSQDLHDTNTILFKKLACVSWGGIAIALISYIMLYTDRLLNADEDWVGLFRGMGNLALYSVGIVMILIILVSIITAVFNNKVKAVLAMYIVISILNISAGIYEVRLEHERDCKEAYYKIIHTGKLIEELLDWGTNITLYFNRIELAAPMQYADEFFDDQDKINWCPIVYWNNHNFKLDCKKTNIFIAMEQDINMDRYKQIGIDLQIVEESNGLIGFEWNDEMYTVSPKDYMYKIRESNGGVYIRYSGDVDTFLIHNDTIYYAKEINNNEREVFLENTDGDGYFELYNLKDATRSGKIPLEGRKAF